MAGITFQEACAGLSVLAGAFLAGGILADVMFRRRRAGLRRGIRSGVFRWAAIIALAGLVVSSVGDPALAVSGQVDTPELPLPDVAGLVSLLTGTPKPDFGTLPKQESGTAAGRRHRVGTGATRAGGGSGHAPKPGKGELPADRMLRRKIMAGPSGRGTTGFLQGTSKRVAAKSTATADYYSNPDGSFTRVLHTGPVNYRDSSGAWQPIDTTLKPAGKGRVAEAANSVEADFAGSAADPALVHLAAGGHEISYGLQGAAAVAPTVEGATATYAGVMAGTDLVVEPTATGLKESLVLRSAEAPSSWVFPLQAKGLTAVAGKDGGIDLVDGAGTGVSRIPPAYAYDSKVDRRSGEPATSYGVSYQLAEQDGRQVLVMTLDEAWLKAKERVFPVTVDPSVTVNTVSTYAESNWPTGDHSSERTIKIGSYDSGTHSANSFLQFPNAGIDASGATVSAASLKLFDTWASICTAERFDVALATQAWTPSSVTSYPGPSHGSSIGNVTPSVPNACANSAANRRVGDWVTVGLTASSINAWAQGSSTDYGLAVYADTSDNLHWKQFDSANNISYGPSLTITYTGRVLPQIRLQSPPSGYTAPSLTPRLNAIGVIDPNLSASVQYLFQLYDANGTKITDSGNVASGDWTIPSGKLKWNQSYYWTVQAYDGTNYSPNAVWNTLSTPVPQPLITSQLSQNAGNGTNPAIGNYTTEDIDAQVRSVGPTLEIVRDYNSRDPRTGGAFGAGWSSLLDARVAEQYDSSGAVISANVTYPDGSVVGYGKNTDGTFTPPMGRFATFKTVTGGYALTDKDDTTYAFTQSFGSGGYGLTSVTDANGRGLTLTWASGQISTMTSASGRALHLTWTTPSGAGGPHVSAVATDAAVSGDPSSVTTWTYAYTGDRLTSVCPPTSATACTTYGYTTGSPYYGQVLDQGAASFWPLAETSGTTAASAVLANEGTDNGTYSGVTLGQAGPLTGGGATAAGFDGSSSMVTLPRTTQLGIQDAETISLWFKTTTAAGVLLSYQEDPVTVGETTVGDYTPALYVGSDGKLNGVFWGSSGSSPMVSSSSVTDGQWHHVVLTANGATQWLYLDGTQIGTKSGLIKVSGQLNDVIGAGYLGGGWPDEPHASTTDTTGYATFFTGSIADVAFFAKTASAADVTGLYTGGTKTTALMTSITRPSGKAYASVTYDPVTASATGLTDGNGGTWAMAPPTVSGSSQVYRGAVLGSAPATYYRLGEAAGATTAVDEVNSGGAAYANVTLGSSGPFSDTTAAAFNGTSSYVQPPLNNKVLTNPASVEMWFKVPAGNTAGGVLFSEQNAQITQGTTSGSYVPALYVGTDGKLHGKFWDANGTSGGLTSTSTVNDGTWHHVVLAASTGSQTLYLDGKTQGTSTATLSTTWGDPNSTYTYIGAGFIGGNWPNEAHSSTTSSTGYATYFPGSIADVAFYRSQMSGQEVAAHFTAAQNSAGLAPVETVQVTDPGGKTLTHRYDPLNGDREIASIDGLGGKTSYGYDTGGFLRTVTDPNGNVDTTGYDVRGNVVSKTGCQNQAANTCSTSYFTYLPDDTSAQLTPNPVNDVLATSADGRSTSASDTRYRTAYTYDAAGNPTRVTTPPVAGFPSGRTTTTYYTDGTTVAAADSGYAPPGLPYKTVTPGGATTLIGYFHNGDVAQQTDAAGLVTRYTYDGLGRALTKTEVSDTYPSGLTATYTYNRLGQVLTEVDPPVTNRVTGAVHQARTTTGYDDDGDVTSQVTADLTGGDASRTVSKTYDGHDQVATATNPLGDARSYTYDGYGNRVTETDENNITTGYAYDPNGKPLTTTLKNYTGDPNNPQTAHDLIQESRAYDPAGRLASVTDSMGTTTSYTYTDDDLPVTVTRTDPTGTKSFVDKTTSYDPAGNDVQDVTNNGATTTTHTVDAANRVTASTLDPTGVARATTVSYDPDDNVTSQTQTDGSNLQQTTSFTYDPLGRLTGRSIGGDDSGHPTGWWKLDQTSGTTAGDSSGTGNTASVGSNTATLAGGVTWSGQAASFPATSGQQIATAGPVMDTSGSFAVSAWVNMTSAVSTGSETAVAQEAGVDSGFLIKYDSGRGTWVFMRPTTDTSSPPNVSAYGTAAAVTGTWTHLVGVYNATNGAMTLYVNGTAVGTATDTTPIKSAGPLVIGRSKWNSVATDLFNGKIGNVQVYQHTLSAADVSAIYTAGRGGATTAAQPAGWWKLDQTSGTTVTDTTNAGFTWTDHAAAFRGIGGQQVATNGPVLDTTGSFSVSAWVNLTTATTSGSQTAVSQEASVNSGFLLKYDSSPKTWVFTRPSTDTTSLSPANAVAGTLAAAGTWTHLVGVYNAASGAMTLYVNGTASGSTTIATSIPANGPLVIGRSKWKGVATDLFSGSVDNVQTYNRPLSGAEVTTLFNAGRNGGTTASYTTATTTWTLDQRGLPTSMTDPNANLTTYDYDEAGQLAATSAPTVSVETGGGTPALQHPVTLTGYDTFGETVEQQDPNGGVTTTGYDAAGQKTTETRPGYTPPGTSTPITAATGWTYDPAGRVTAQTDPLGHTTHTVYDQLDNVAKVTDVAGGVTTNVHDTAGDLLATTTPSGAQTQATYDYLGRPLTSTRLERYPAAVAATTTDSYTTSAANPGGAFLASETTPNGAVTGYGHNHVGETTSVTDPAGNTTTTTYDPWGRTTKVTNPDGTGTKWTLNPYGQATSTVQLDTNGTTALATTSATYDAMGRTLSATDANGHTTTLTRDALGHITAVVKPVDATHSITTSAGYDAVGNRTRYTDGRGNAWIYGYNTWNQPETAQQPATATYTTAADRTSTITYDAAGRETKRTLPGAVTITSGYDNLGDLTSQTGSGADAPTADRAFTYDGDGRMTSAGTSAIGTSTPATSENFTYDDRGDLLTTAGSAGAGSFAYNNDGLTTTRTDASGTTTYTYDGADRLATLNDAATGTQLTYGYNTLSQPTTITYGTTANTRTYGYDHLHRPTSDTLKTTGGTTIASITYGYDNNGNETSKTTTGFTGSAANTYTYDWANRLTSWNNGTTTTGYGYDASSNRTQIGAKTYTYDARDQLTTDGTSTYTYTARGTLTTQTTGGTGTASSANAYGNQITVASGTGTQTYLTDALGRAITDTGTTGTTTFAYGGTGNTLASDGISTYTHDPANNLIGIGAPGASTGVLAYLDQHDDVIGDFTATGNILTGSTAYDPLGNITASTGAVGKLGYQSAWTDSATGKVNMWARWYTPASGQFQNKDTLDINPIPNSEAANPFAYAGNNPLTSIDPDGHEQGPPGAWCGSPSCWPTKKNPGEAYQVNKGCIACSSRTWGSKHEPWQTHKVIRNAIKSAISNHATYVRDNKPKPNPPTYTGPQGPPGATCGSPSCWPTSRNPGEAYQVNHGCFTCSPKTWGTIGADWQGKGTVIGAILDAATNLAVENDRKKVCDQGVNALTRWECLNPGAPWQTNPSPVAPDGHCGALCNAWGGIVSEITDLFEGSNIATGNQKIYATPYGSGVTNDPMVNRMNDYVDGTLGADRGSIPFQVGRLLAPLLIFPLPGEAAEEGGAQAGAEGEGILNRFAGWLMRGCRGNSFVPDTQVVLSNGATKAIKDIKVGDVVESTDPVSGATEPKKVIASFGGEEYAHLVEIGIGSGLPQDRAGMVIATEHHLFWDRTTRNWVRADMLKLGESLRGPQGEAYRVVSLANLADHPQVRDLTVAGFHTFYVLAGQTPVLVHNSGGCGDAIVDPGKWDYLFGRVTKGSHNAPRSAQNLSQLNRIGIHDTPEGRQILQDFFDGQVSGTGNIIREYTDQYGTFQIRDGLLSGPGGFLHVESAWQVTDNGLRLTTIIPRGGP